VRPTEGDFSLFKKDLTFLKLIKHSDAIKDRGLARSVRANQAQNLTFVHIETNTNQNFVSTETQVDIIDSQHFLIGQSIFPFLEKIFVKSS
jgi:acyl CoA:acetate/3-ketoacid CoA transferase alpha subunit